MSAPSSAPTESMLVPRMREVIVEVTSRCNLRCLYCAVSQPGYVGKDLEGDPETILRGILELSPREVQINGHGETTMLPGWIRLSDLLSHSGVPVTLTSNLAREYEPDEIAALARLERLTVSCDTSDPALYARLRRGGRLERIEINLRAIRAAARVRGVRGPKIAINCTFSHLVVSGLSELVRWAKRFDLDAVALTNLELYPGLPGKLVLRHPAQVDPVGAQIAIREARRIARRSGLDFYTMGGLDDDLETAARAVREGRNELVPFDQDEHVPGSPAKAPAVASNPAPPPEPPALAASLPPPAEPAREVPAGRTRDCIDPWEYAFVHADGGVSLCCWAPSIGNLRDASMREIVRGSQARALRTELLSGRLGEACRACPARGLVPTQALHKRVERTLRPGILLRALSTLKRRLAKQRRRLEALARLVPRPRTAP